MTATAARAVSPCSGVCRLDDGTGWCIGCGRSGEEIGAWRGACDGERAAIVDALPARLAAIDRPMRRLGGEEFVRAALAPVLNGLGGIIAVGCHGAAAAFAPPRNTTAQVWESRGTITASTPGGRLRLCLIKGIAAFASDDSAAPLVLAVPDTGRRFSPANGPCSLDPDDVPSSLQNAGRLCDLNIGLTKARILLRTPDQVLRHRLFSLESGPLERLLATEAAVLAGTDAGLVAETLAARVEVDTPVPLSSRRRAHRPHVILKPGAVALRRLLPPGLRLPPDLVPVALIHPQEA